MSNNNTQITIFGLSLSVALAARVPIDILLLFFLLRTTSYDDVFIISFPPNLFRDSI